MPLPRWQVLAACSAVAVLLLGTSCRFSTPATAEVAGTAPTAGIPSSGESRPAAGPRLADRIVIASPVASLNNVAIDLGIQQGIYTQHGVDVQRVMMPSDTSIAGLLSGEVQYTTATGSLARAIATGVPGRILMYMVDLPSHSLYARPSFQSVKELGAARIGVESAVSDTRVELDAVLVGNGLNPADVEIRTVGGDRIASLVGGVVDAAILAPPEDVHAARAGFVRLASVKDYTSLPNSGLGASSQYVAEHREAVKRVIAATVQGSEFVKSHRDETIQFIADLVQVSRDEAAFLYDEIPWAQDGTARPEGLAASLRWIQQTAQLPDSQMVAPADVVDYSILQEVLSSR